MQKFAASGSSSLCRNICLQVTGLLLSQQLALNTHDHLSMQAFLADCGIVHGSLACHNICIGKDKRLKISNFGAYTCNPGSAHLRWMAPESISRHEFKTASDVWAYGIVLWEICTMGKPAELFLVNLTCTVRGGFYRHTHTHIAEYSTHTHTHTHTHTRTHAHTPHTSWLNSIFVQLHTLLYSICTIGGFPYPIISDQDLPRLLQGGHRLEQPENVPPEM